MAESPTPVHKSAVRGRNWLQSGRRTQVFLDRLFLADLALPCVTMILLLLFRSGGDFRSLRGVQTSFFHREGVLRPDKVAQSRPEFSLHVTG